MIPGNWLRDNSHMNPSTTPRTDAQTRDVFDGDGELPEMGSRITPGGFYVTADFARQLERENAALVAAARDLYLSDHWTGTKLAHAEQVAKWEAFRVALGIEHGISPKP